MSDYTTEKVRNIALVGHAGAGKTTLVESLLVAAGAVANPGSVEKGTTISDSDPLEKSVHHSVSASVVSLDWKGIHINLIDTPGSPDFLGQMLAVLPSVETVAVVINAQTGIESTVRQMMQIAGERGLCRLIIVNRIDAEGVELEPLLEQIRASFGSECLALNLPSRAGAEVADCFFTPAGEADFSSVEAAHDMLVDQVVEVDEELMALYLEQGETINPGQLHAPFEAALREGHLVPICFASAKSGAGLAELLDVSKQLMPNPLEGNPPPFIREGESGVREYHAEPDPDKHALAHVVKIDHDPFMGKLAIFRVHQGTVARDSRLYVGDARKPFKSGNLFKLRGKERNEIDHCIPGDICAVAKVEELHFDAVLHDSHDEDHIRLRPVDLPTPVFGMAVWAARHSDEQKLSEVLAKLAEEDPGLRIEQNRATHETVLWGLGDRHLQLTLEKMQQRFNLEIKTKPPSIAYRETVTAAAEGHCRHKKQTGGAGQFGEVFLRIAPLPRGRGFEFVNEIRGGVIPASLIPAVEKGVQQVLSDGAIAGYPMQDVQVTVYDGKTHSVDSKEIAFVIAGRKAFLDAVRKAHPIVLEPIVKLAIDAPSMAMGDITGDVSARRGRIQDTQSHSEQITLHAVAPLAELEDFPSKLKAMTGGEGNYQLQFSHYEPVSSPIQQQLVSKYRPVEEEA